MTYSTVSTKATGDAIAASDWNTYIRDNLADHEARMTAQSFSGALVTRTTNQSLTTATNTLISWTTETTDQGGWFPGSGTTFTVPSGALPSGFTYVVVQISVTVPWEGNSTGTRKVEIYKNAALYALLNVTSPPDANNFAVTVTAPDISCIPGDTFAINVSQSSGGALNLLGASASLTCSIRRVGHY